MCLLRIPPHHHHVLSTQYTHPPFQHWDKPESLLYWIIFDDGEHYECLRHLPCWTRDTRPGLRMLNGAGKVHAQEDR